MQVGVYSDFSYRLDGDVVLAEEAFSMFAAGMAEHLEQVVLIGRLDPRAEHHPYPLPAGVGFVALPHYETLSRPLDVVRAALGSMRRYWRALDDLDGVWLLGPHPLALVFAAIAVVRRRRVILGTRQDFPEYVRSRHPGRHSLWVAALVLEVAWRVLALRLPVVVVGPELARKYRHSRRLLVGLVSLVRAADITDSDDARARSDGSDLRLLSVGRLDAEKNPLLLADALAHLRAVDPHWRLVVCGSGSLQPALVKRLEELELAEDAELRGYVPLDRLVPIYRESDVFLHVSWTEGFPQVILEAFAAGLPVVATDVGGVGEMVGDAAVLIPPGDAESAARAVVQVAGDPSLRARLVRSGLVRARQRTLEAETARVAAFIETGSSDSV